jgi:superfamily II DNA helicase RecQ
MTTDFDDEFGLDEDDEQALQALADADDADKHGRKHARNESGVTEGPPTKLMKTNDEHVDNVALDVATKVLKTRFKLPGFRLKQSLAISRILNGGSSVVVFPTGKIDVR